MNFEEFMHQRVDTIPGNICKEPLRIGIVGYSDDSKISDKEWAIANISWALGKAKEELQYKFGHCDKFILVSGLTDTGIPGMAYHLTQNGKHNKSTYVKTVGYACSKAKDFTQFPVDEKHIIGNNWGDESQEFLSNIDCLVRVGGGKQSLEEVKLFKEKYPEKPLIEFSL
jgi:hypothetical protein